MKDRPALSPYCLMSYDRALSYIKRPTAQEQEDGDDDLVVLALNAITGLFKAATGRRLAARTYRTPVVLNGTTTTTALTVAGAGFVNGATPVHSLDDATHPALPAGTRVASVDSDVQLTLAIQQPATLPTAAGVQAITFGSAPLRLDCDDPRMLHLPEWPVQALYSVTYLDDAGNRWPLDLSLATLDPISGRLRLRNPLLSRGNLAVEVECKAGYQRPAAGVLGDPDEWADLELHFGRTLQVLFQDVAQLAGRGGDEGFMSLRRRIASFELPADIVAALYRYRRDQ